MRYPSALFLANGKPFSGTAAAARTIQANIVVNGETVPKAVVAAEAQNHDAPRGKPHIAWSKAANAVAVRTLLLQEAQRRSLKPQPNEVEPGRFETNEEALIRGLLETAINVSPPTDADLQAEWARDPSRFRGPPLWDVSHILCGCDPRAEEAKNVAHTRALELNRLALEEPNGFAQLAKEHSDCASKSMGGSLGQLGPGDTVPEFEKVLRTLSYGQITSKPALSRHGWHIVRMDAVAEGAVLPFDAVRQKISDAMEKASWARAARLFVNQLVASAEISGADLRSDQPMEGRYHEQPRT